MRKSLSQLRRKLKAAHEKQKDPKREFLQQYTLAEGFLYVTDMGKDFIDTFVPYKTKRHRDRDLFQLYYGLKNTILGLWSLTCTLIVVVFVDLMLTCFDDYTLKGAIFNLGVNLLGSTAQIFRGVTQILTSPLSLLRAIPRSILSRDKEWEAFQDRKSIIALVKRADSILDNGSEDNTVGSMRLILDELIRKAKSNEVKKQQTRHPLQTEKEYRPFKKWPLGQETETSVILQMETSLFFPEWINLQHVPVKDEDPLTGKQKAEIAAYLQSFRQ